MAKPAETYAKTAQKTGSPRELEAQLLMRAAAKLQAAKSATDPDTKEEVVEIHSTVANTTTRS